MILPITLTIAGAAAIVNIWLMMRVGKVRMAEKVSVGDGGNDKVIRRMRAHANYGESLPIVLILIGVIELASISASGQSPVWLWIVGGLYMLGRIAHGLGMDGGKLGKGRMIGTLLTMLTLLGLGLYAIAIPYLSFQNPAITAGSIQTSQIPSKTL